MYLPLMNENRRATTGSPRKEREKVVAGHEIEREREYYERKENGGEPTFRHQFRIAWLVTLLFLFGIYNLVEVLLLFIGFLFSYIIYILYFTT